MQRTGFESRKQPIGLSFNGKDTALRTQGCRFDFCRAGKGPVAQLAGAVA
jgi:hypothetical protein